MPCGRVRLVNVLREGTAGKCPAGGYLDEQVIVPQTTKQPSHCEAESVTAAAATASAATGLPELPATAGTASSSASPDTGPAMQDGLDYGMIYVWV